MKRWNWLIVLLAVLLVFTTGCTLLNADKDKDGTPKKKKITLTAYASSENLVVDNPSDKDHNPASYALDGDPNTMWHSRWSGGGAPGPHSITIVLSEVAYVDELRYLPRQDSESNGTILGYEIQYSIDGSEDSFIPIAEGVWENNKDKKVAEFDSVVEAKEIRLVNITSTNGDAAAAEVEISYTIIEEESSETEE